MEDQNEQSDTADEQTTLEVAQEIKLVNGEPAPEGDQDSQDNEAKPAETKPEEPQVYPEPDPVERTHVMRLLDFFKHLHDSHDFLVDSLTVATAVSGLLAFAFVVLALIAGSISLHTALSLPVSVSLLAFFIGISVVALAFSVTSIKVALWLEAKKDRPGIHINDIPLN